MSIDSDIYDVLAKLDAATMTTPQVLDAVQAAVPGAGLEAIGYNLERLATDERQHAKELNRFVRTKRAGITGVVDGPKGAA